MLDILEKLRFEAKKSPRRIIFPEGSDERVVAAARALLREKLLVPVLVRADALPGIECVRPGNDSEFDALTDAFYSANAKKYDSRDQAAEALNSPLFFAAMKLKTGSVDGFVGGASSSTADTVRALLRCVGLKKEAKILSSFFLMILNERNMLFADCAIIPAPTSEQLADIALQTARSYKTFIGDGAKVALLSFSTLGSATALSPAKVRRAWEILKSEKRDFEFIGEIQADAALVPEIAMKKTGGEWKGGANVLIFPDLNSGNIGYKLVERLAGASAIGPVLQGLDKPGNDLSRGCSEYDIINVALFTATQCGENN
ncbi:MAG: phosphate acetyltransferase [Elusimicrobia bacterium CG03_land_8_20_14_0_80_50_18]|nr:MAG: phosphate acetyltransferase [Elusimicrobia bacterium CG03_land_8_20_14_0_80_50_18]